MPKVKNFKGAGNSFYSDAQLVTIAPRFIVDALRPKVPGVIYNLDKTPYRKDIDNLSPEELEAKGFSETVIRLEHERLVPEEAEYLKSHADEIIKSVVDNRLEYTYRKSDSVVDNACKKIKSDYVPLSSAERKQRAAISETIRKKYAAFSAKHSIAIKLANQAFSGRVLGRTEQCLITPGVTPEITRKNEEIASKLRSGNPKLIADAYQEKIKSLVSFDAANFDIGNDQFIADNFELCEEILASAPEMKALLTEYQKYYDVTPEQKTVFEKLGAITDMAYILRAKIDTLTSPIYSQIRTEDFYCNKKLTQIGIEIDNEQGDIEDATYESLLELEDGEHKEYYSAFGQIGFVNSYFGSSPIFEPGLSPQERFANYSSHYWDGSFFAEIKPSSFMTELSDIGIDAQPGNEPQEQNADIQNIQEEVKADIQNIQEEVKADIALEEEHKKEAEEFLKTEEGQRQTYDKALRENIARIQKIIPDFKLSEDEIRQYTSPEYFEFSKKAAEYDLAFDARKKIAKEMKVEIPGAFSRCLSAFLKDSGTPENDQYNKDFINNLIDPSQKGIEFRANLFAKLAANFKNLDGKRLVSNKSFKELADYVFPDFDIWETGFEFQNTRTSMASTMGFDVIDELKDDFDNVLKKAVTLGGIGRMLKSIAIEPFFFTMPFDKLSYDQINKLRDSGIFKGTDISERDLVQMAMYQDCLRVNDGSDPEPSDYQYSKDDFKLIVPNFDDINNQINELAKGLKKTDHLYNLNNSSEFKNMMSKLDKYLTDTKNPEALRGHMKERLDEVTDAVRAYIGHVREGVKKNNPNSKALGKNANQIERRKLADELLTVLSTSGSSSLINEMMLNQHFEALANQPMTDMKDEIANDAEFQRKNNIFNAGLKRTEELRVAIESLPKGYKKEIGQIALDAREYLTDNVGRNELNVTKVRQAMATVVAHTYFAQSIKDMPDAEQTTYQARHKFEKSVQDLCSNSAFISMTNDLNSDMINQFLDAKGEQAFVKNMINVMYTHQNRPEPVNNELKKDDPNNNIFI